MILGDQAVDAFGEFVLVGNAAFRNVEIDAAAILGNGATGHRIGHRGAEQMHQRMGAHVAIADRPVELERRRACRGFGNGAAAAGTCTTFFVSS